MLSKTDAIARVEERLNQFDPDWPTRPRRLVDDSMTEENPWGWVLYYGVPEEYQMGRRGDLPADNPPILVDKHSGRIVETVEDESLEIQVDRFGQKA